MALMLLRLSNVRWGRGQSLETYTNNRTSNQRAGKAEASCCCAILYRSEHHSSRGYRETIHTCVGQQEKQQLDSQECSIHSRIGSKSLFSIIADNRQDRLVSKPRPECNKPMSGTQLMNLWPSGTLSYDEWLCLDPGSPVCQNLGLTSTTVVRIRD